ncbi:MAG: GNAT family N-acetyltransferase [Candidatus Binatia bacterium]
MSSYRFCRTDDIPLLVDAYNACYVPHFAEEPPLTIDGFKRRVRELNLWSSSCMLAFEGDRPIAVLLAAKRAEANLVHRIAVRPGEERRGHGRHLLASLGKKLAILGPPRLVAEVPSEWIGVREFFEAAGFEAETRTADFALEALRDQGRAVEARDLVSELTLDDLVESGAFDTSIRRSWERSLATLRNRAAEIEGLAVASDLRIEAYLLHRPEPSGGGREIVALGAASEATATPLLRLLVGCLYERENTVLRLAKVSEQEVRFSDLVSWGFRCEREFIGYSAPIHSG